MQKLGNAILAKVMPITAKISTNRYLSAIRDGFAAILPLIIAGSVFTLFNNLIFGPTGLTMTLFHNPCTSLVTLGNSVISATMNMMGLLAAFTIAYALAKSYKLDPIVYAATAVVGFLILTPIAINPAVKMEVVSTNYLGSQAVFMAFMTGIGGVQVMRFFNHFKALVIKMPDSVPPAIAQSFNGLIPSLLTVIVFTVIRGVTNLSGLALNDLIFKLIQTPFTHLISSPFTIAIIYFFYMLLWGLGIHSASIFSIVNTAYVINITSNAAILSGTSHGHLEVMTRSFLNGMAFMGGAGNMLALIVAVFLVSKRKDYRDICKIGLIPALFNISEPIMFGLPVVMNPFLIIPMILTTLISLGLGALMTITGLMAYTSVIVPWVTPPILLTFLGTRGNVLSALMALIVFVVAVLTYIPFVLIMNHTADQSGVTDDAA